MIKKDVHTHKFTKKISKKVLVYREKGSVSAQDLIKSRKCACGAVMAYDLERTVV